MRKQALLFLLCLAGIVAGCGKSAVTPNELTPFPDAPWVEDETLPVPIQFGSSSYGVNVQQTKAAINSLTDVPFGILALDDEYLASEIAATPGTDGTDALLLLDKKGVMTTADVDGDENTENIVQFKEGNNNITYYYPIYSRYNYSFYGYKTTAADEDEPTLTWDATNHTYTIPNITLGDFDILWAKSDAEPFTYTTYSANPINGFNARFMRQARAKQAAGEQEIDGETYFKWVNHLPAIQFEHKTAALHFQVKAADAAAEASFGTDLEPLVQVTGLKVSGTLATTAKLDVISGELTGTASAAQEINLIGTPFRPTVDPQEFGEGMFILPTEEVLTLVLTLSEPNNRTEAVAVSLENVMPEGGFVAGTSYAITVTVDSLEQIYVKIGLDGWTEYVPANPIEID